MLLSWMWRTAERGLRGRTDSGESDSWECESAPKFSVDPWKSPSPLRAVLERWCACALPEHGWRHMPPRKITVLLADDHALVRRGFRRMLEDDSEISVVGEAGDGKQAVKLALELKPAVIVMDCAMPEQSGIEAARQIHQKLPDAQILMLSMHAEDTLVRQALEAGARGYVLKNADNLDLVRAVRTVAQGKQVIDPQLAKPAALKGEHGAGLTARELEILQHIVAGKSNKEIAAELSLSANTVAVHRANIMDALGIHKTAEVAGHSSRNRLRTDRLIGA